MSITPFDNIDWFRRFFDRGNFLRRGYSELFDMDPARAFEEMEREMQNIFGQFKDIQTNPPEDLVREYESSDGSKIKEIGPIVYGYSMTIGPDGKPKIQEFGNIKNAPKGIGMGRTRLGTNPQITAEREPLADVNVTDKEVKAVIEMPGVKKDTIKVNVYDTTLEVTTNDPQRKYHKIVEIPKETDLESVKSSYNNGILEIIFSKKKETKPKGKEIKID